MLQSRARDERGAGDDRTRTLREEETMHPRDGKIAEAWILVQDLHALDGFLNSLPG